MNVGDSFTYSTLCIFGGRKDQLVVGARLSRISRFPPPSGLLIGRLDLGKVS